MKIYRTSYEETPKNSRLALYDVGSEGPRVIAIGGFSGRSFSEGPIAQSLAAAAQNGARCTMIDIASTGNSKYSGDLTMDTWLNDLEYVFEKRGGGAAIWVGASIGAWIMLLLHKRHPEWFQSMCALSPAIDWDVQYVEPGLKSGKFYAVKGYIMSGKWPLLPTTLLDTMARNRLLDTPLQVSAPLHVIQGGRDVMALPAFTRRLVAQVSGAPVTFEMLDDDDHGVAKLASPIARERFEAWLLPQLVQRD